MHGAASTAWWTEPTPGGQAPSLPSVGTCLGEEALDWVRTPGRAFQEPPGCSAHSPRAAARGASLPLKPSLFIPLDPRHRLCGSRCCPCLVAQSVRLFATPWTVAHQAPLSIRFSRQEDWSGLPCPPPGDLPNPGVEPASPALAGGFFTTSATKKPYITRWALVRGEARGGI